MPAAQPAPLAAAHGAATLGPLGPRPRLRGHLHLAAVPIAVAGLVWLVLAAPNPRSAWAAAIYGLAAVALYAVSACYHVVAYRTRARHVLQRLDHATIYLKIAATYTPVCLLALAGPLRALLLVAVWSLAVAGALLKLVSFHRFPRLSNALYLVMGWLALVALPHLWSRPLTLGFILAGGLLYTLGAALFLARWPRRPARWFGYHELWHALGLAAGAALFVAVAVLVHAG